MSEGRMERWIGAIGVVVLLALFLFLPSVQGGIYASPDETAVAVVTQQLIQRGQAFLEEPLAQTIPWLHPRSWVSVGERLVPVGFLAWPWFLHWADAFLGAARLPILASLLILSGIIPWYALLRSRFGWRWAMLGTALFFFFPTVLLYGNRSLFANQAQLMGLLWVVWLMDCAPVFASRWGTRAVRLLTGALIILTLCLRPVESVWILPWLAWWGMRHPPLRVDRPWMALGGLVMALPLGWVASQTYGSWYAIGYFFRDNTSPLFVSSLVPSAVVFSSTTAGIFSRLEALLPYGFHPRHIWWNGIHFLLVFLWPWACFVIGLIILAIRRGLFVRSPLKRLPFTPAILALWTASFLFVVYGSGLYADHIRPGAVTGGNSFLRYVLPLVPLYVIAVLLLLRQLVRARWERPLVVLVVVCLSFAGIYWSFARDDEGLIFTRREVIRYAQVRQEVAQRVPSSAIILSERSDKIFFPSYRAVSPLPPIEQVRLALGATADPFYLYVRPLSGIQRDAWRAQGIDVVEVVGFGREKLYRLTLFQR